MAGTARSPASGATPWPATPGTAYLVQGGDDWHEVSWADAAERVENLANGLLARGVRKGEAFAILARTTLEWALFDFALAQVGAVGAAIYANSSPQDVAYILEHSESVGVLCEDEAQRAKVDGRARRAARACGTSSPTTTSLRSRRRAARIARRIPAALDDAVAAIDEEDLFTFIYTSGTTGPPKGCMIRHRNYYAMVSVIDHLPSYSDAGRRDAALPPARPQLRAADAPHRPVRRLHDRVPPGSARGRARAARGAADRSCRACRASTRRSTPRSRRRSTRRPACDAGSSTGRSPSDGAASALRAQGTPLPRGLALQHRLADRLVFAKMRERLGGRLRTPISGGAPLAQEIARVLRRDRHPDPRGLRPDRVHDGGDDEPPDR